MSQQDKPNTAKQEGVGEYSVWWSKDNPTRQCTTHHNACNCREEKFQKLEAALKDALEALEFDFDYYEAKPHKGIDLLREQKQALERIRKVLG